MPMDHLQGSLNKIITIRHVALRDAVYLPTADLTACRNLIARRSTSGENYYI